MPVTTVFAVCFLTTQQNITALQQAMSYSNEKRKKRKDIRRNLGSRVVHWGIPVPAQHLMSSVRLPRKNVSFVM